MPLDKSCSIAAFRRNIRAEIKAGKTPERAAAIARSTLEAACSEEGKVVPRAVEKGYTREYLEAALDAARKMLPGHLYAVLHRAALPSSGGRAARNRRLSAMEKLWVERTPSRLNKQELQDVYDLLRKEHASRQRQKRNLGRLLSRASEVREEMCKRDLLPEGDEELKKGFVNGQPEGGMHAHGLDRRNNKTSLDGGHMHLFVAPGTGDHLLTWEDGSHAHELSDNGEKTVKDGKHSHRVELPDGTRLETKLGGAHTHALMVETTALDGAHTHRLVLPDGTVVESLTVAEYVSRFVNVSLTPPVWAPPASFITGALNELQRREEMESDVLELPPLGPFVEKFAQLGERPSMPTTTWRVVEKADGGAVCSVEGEDVEALFLNPPEAEITIETGDVVKVDMQGAIVGFSEAAIPDTADHVQAVEVYADELQKATSDVGFVGPQDAKLVFVCASPSAMEVARKEALIGPDGELFRESYLEPLGLKKQDIAVGFAIPVRCDAPTTENIELWRDRLLKSVSHYSRSRVVALGRVAKEALGPLAVCSLPHPAAVRRHDDSGEVSRKIKKLAKTLDISSEDGKGILSPADADPIQGPSGATLTDAISEQRKEHTFRVEVLKAAPKKQIIYGVVLDAYQVDLQNDWSPPAEIESTAHDFLEKSRIIGLRHSGQADAVLVESWIEKYPSDEDYQRALQNLPHTVYRQKLGSDVVHSGAWVIGVRLSDELWALHLKGELDAFSIGGRSLRIPVSPDTMPEVEIVDLVPAA